MRYIVVIFVGLLFVACASKEVQTDVVDEEIVVKDSKKIEKNDVKKVLQRATVKATAKDSKKDTKKAIENSTEPLELSKLVDIPQSVTYYTRKLDAKVALYNIQKRYEKYYFNVWRDSKPRESLKNIKWSFAYFKFGDSYGENYEQLEQNFFDEMLESANFKNYGTLNKKAISLVDINMRVFPTDKPLLRDPKRAGEGFPFDYMQNTTVHANKPLFLSHYSKNREWAYVFTSFASGWVKSRDIVVLKKTHISLWKKAQQIIFTKEGVALYAKDKRYLFSTKIGTMLPLISQNDDSYTVLAVSRYRNSEPMFEEVVVSKDIAQKDSLELSKDSLEKIMSEIIKSNYGWGGLYGQRDCSSTMRDLFAPFGIWLPRNSSQQAKVGKVISLENMSDRKKIETIKEKAIPFQTLLHKKGHIVLYVGLLDGEIVVFHNIWGVKTNIDGVEGRAVIGKTIFSGLRVGEGVDGYDEELGLLRNLKSMNIITH